MKFTSIFKVSLIILMVLSSSFIECVEISRQHAKHASKKHRLARKQKASKAEQKLQQLVKLGEEVLRLRYSAVNDAISNEVKSLFDLYNAKEIQLQFNADQIKKMSEEEKATGPFSHAYDDIDQKIKDKVEAVKRLYKVEIDKLTGDASSATNTLIAKEQQQLQEVETCKQQIFNLNAKINEASASLSSANDAQKEAVSVEMDDQVKSLGQVVVECTLQVQDFLKSTNPSAFQQQQKSLQEQARELVNKAIERNLPPKFCWKIVTSTKVCNEADHEMKFFKCRTKCTDGQTRFGVWCLDDCTKAEKEANTCEIKHLGLKIAKKNAAGEWHSKFREWHESNSNENYSETCPHPYQKQEVDTIISLFKKKKTICVSDPPVNCANIGMQNCGSNRACSTTTKSCALTVATIASDVTVGILKFSSLFVAPGAINALEWTIKAVQWANTLKDIVKQVDESLHFFKEIHKNPVQRQILLQKVFNEVKDAEVFKQLNAANSRFKKSKKRRMSKKARQTDLEKKIKMYIDYVDEFQYQNLKRDNGIGKMDTAEKVINFVFEQMTQYSTAADAANKNIVKNWIKQNTEKKFFLFQKETYTKMLDAVTMKNASPEMKFKAVLGVASSFDPSGITNILKAFVYDRCPTNGYFTNEEIALIKADKSWSP